MSYRQTALGGEIVSICTGPIGSVVILKDGTVTAAGETVANITGNIYSVTFLPYETGVYVVLVDEVVIDTVEVVFREALSYLRNLEDQALGSWEWNKTTKVMTLLRQDGSVLAEFDTDDTLEEAYSRLI